nr:MAG TPA: hypothetical protein [Caudoviricetes sp.]DAQ91182.1 MAG TPA: hypothetical protein [Caudoviricetes sp.]
MYPNTRKFSGNKLYLVTFSFFYLEINVLK